MAERVQHEMEAFAEEHKGRPEPTLSGAETQHAQAVAQALGECMARALNPPAP